MLAHTQDPVDDIHQQMAGWLHVVCGALFVLGAGLALAFFGTLLSFVLRQPEVTDRVAAVLATVQAYAGALLGGFVVLGILQIIIAGMWLAGRRGARMPLLVVSAIQLMNVPFGTALGLYTFWALLRGERPGARPPVA